MRLERGLFVVCTFLVKSVHFALSPLGIRLLHRYSDNEATRYDRTLKSSTR